MEEGSINNNFKNSLEKQLLNNKFNIFTYMKNNNIEVEETDDENQTNNIVNPASTYCEEDSEEVVIEDE